MDGWPQVYAGCLTEAGVASLAGEAVDRLVAVPMDVTDEAQVSAVLQRVRAEHPSTGLHCLVNNAGRQAGSTTHTRQAARSRCAAC